MLQLFLKVAPHHRLLSPHALFLLLGGRASFLQFPASVHDVEIASTYHGGQYAVATTDTTSTVSADNGEPPCRHVQRRRKRSVHCEGDGSQPPSILVESGDHEPDESTNTAPSSPSIATTRPSMAAIRPICIIDQSTSLDGAKADLRRALVVTIGGNRPMLSADQVL